MIIVLLDSSLQIRDSSMSMEYRAALIPRMRPRLSLSPRLSSDLLVEFLSMRESREVI